MHIIGVSTGEPARPLSRPGVGFTPAESTVETRVGDILVSRSA